VLTGANGDATTIAMAYNRGNQLTGMRSALGNIQYSYDKNGNLATRSMARGREKLRDTYTYDALDRLVGYEGYDGFEQRYTLDANGLRTGLWQQGDANRLTLEEMLQGKKVEENPLTSEAEADAAAPDAGEWVKTSYIYDVTLPYGQLLTESTGGKTTSYTYGLERISALSSTGAQTQYVYDGRGSVAQAIQSMPGFAVPKISSQAYTPFGEQLGQKTTGFGFNGEWYDAAAGMQNLRARQYEPAMMRFTQQDVVRSNKAWPLSLNRYLYVRNDPLNMIDPSGMRPADEEDAKFYFTDKVATAKAKSATKASGAKQDKLLQDWFSYCDSHSQYLMGDVLKAYNDAKAAYKNGGKLTDKAREALLAACRGIAEADEKNKARLTGEDKENISNWLTIYGGNFYGLIVSQQYTYYELLRYIEEMPISDGEKAVFKRNLLTEIKHEYGSVEKYGEVMKGEKNGQVAGFDFLAYLGDHIAAYPGRVWDAYTKFANTISYQAGIGSGLYLSGEVRDFTLEGGAKMDFYQITLDKTGLYIKNNVFEISGTVGINPGTFSGGYVGEYPLDGARVPAHFETSTNVGVGVSIYFGFGAGASIKADSNEFFGALVDLLKTIATL
jgi:RHS repeat-associated protein